MEPQTLVLQRKIAGVLIRAAREKARRHCCSSAQQLSVSPARMRQYERGSRDISLPELEILALDFQTPLSFFLSGGGVPIEKDASEPPTIDVVIRAADGARRQVAASAAGGGQDKT